MSLGISILFFDVAFVFGIVIGVYVLMLIEEKLSNRGLTTKMKSGNSMNSKHVNLKDFTEYRTGVDISRAVSFKKTANKIKSMKIETTGENKTFLNKDSFIKTLDELARKTRYGFMDIRKATQKEVQNFNGIIYDSLNNNRIVKNITPNDHGYNTISYYDRDCREYDIQVLKAKRFFIDVILKNADTIFAIEGGRWFNIATGNQE